MSLCCRRRQWLFMHGQMRILPDTEAGGTQLYVPLSLCPPGMVPVKTSRKSFKNKALGESTFISRVLHYHGPHPRMPVIFKQMVGTRCAVLMQVLSPSSVRVGQTVALPQSSIVTGQIEALPFSQFLQEPIKALAVVTPIADMARALAGVSLVAPIEALPTPRPTADLARALKKAHCSPTIPRCCSIDLAVPPHG
jgi:hypothetical protein